MVVDIKNGNSEVSSACHLISDLVPGLYGQCIGPWATLIVKGLWEGGG